MAPDERRAPRQDDAGPDTPRGLAVAVESVANRAADVIRATARAVGGNRLELYHDEDIQTRWPPSLSTSRRELTALADRAPRARTGGARAPRSALTV